MATVLPGGISSRHLRDEWDSVARAANIIEVWTPKGIGRIKILKISY